LSGSPAGPRAAGFYDRPVLAVAADLVGCLVVHGETSGRIVETEAYHETEPACHAYAGLTARTRVLFGPPGFAYVYRSYGVHALLNAVTEAERVGAAVLIRALEPLDGLDLMRERRGLERREDLCSGPGKLTQALGIGLDLNGTPLDGPIEVLPRPAGSGAPSVATGGRIGINRAMELPWRFCDTSSRSVSRPWPPAMRRRAA
jgi:DNA-3-methyladenine glycosylase